MKRQLTLVAVALAALSSSAFAGSTTATFKAAATLTGTCTISATSMNFGSVTPATSGTTTANASITVLCSNDVTANALFTADSTLGVGDDQNDIPRQMGGQSGNTDKLKYALSGSYPDGSAMYKNDDNSFGFGLRGTGVNQVFAVTGTMPLNQYLKPDTYTDNVTVTLAY